MSYFANAGKWAEAVAPTTKPSWFGYAERQILGSVDRLIAELTGRKQRKDADDSPWKKGQKLLELLSRVPGMTGTLEAMIGAALEQDLIAVPWSERSRDKTQSAFAGYMSAKEKYATAQYYRLEELGMDRATEEQQQRALMAMLRALDSRSIQTDLSFGWVLQNEFSRHMETGLPWLPSHEGDREILKRLSVKIDPQTGRIHGPSEEPMPKNADIGPVGADDPLAEAGYREQLSQCLQLLPADERYAVEVLYFDQDNKRNLPPKELRQLWDRALKILKRRLNPDSE